MMNMTEGIMSEGWIVMNIREMMGLRNRIGIISERRVLVEMILFYDGRMDCGEYQTDNRWLRNRVVEK